MLRQFGFYLCVPSPIKVLWMAGLGVLNKDVFGLWAIPLGLGLFFSWRADSTLKDPQKFMWELIFGNGRTHQITKKCEECFNKKPH